VGVAVGAGLSVGAGVNVAETVEVGAAVAVGEATAAGCRVGTGWLVMARVGNVGAEIGLQALNILTNTRRAAIVLFMV